MPNIDPIAWLDQEDARTAECIRRYGVYLTYVGGGSCSTPGCAGGDSDEGPASATRSASSVSVTPSSSSSARTPTRPPPSSTTWPRAFGGVRTSSRAS